MGVACTPPAGCQLLPHPAPPDPCSPHANAKQAEHPDVIGEVRGEGLMIGIEIVSDAATQEPSPALAAALKRHCKVHHCVLLSSEGPFASVLKIKPPICFSEADVDRMVEALGCALREMGADELAALAERSRAEVAAIEERHRRLG